MPIHCEISSDARLCDAFLLRTHVSAKKLQLVTPKKAAISSSHLIDTKQLIVEGNEHGRSPLDDLILKPEQITLHGVVALLTMPSCCIFRSIFK